ncbi:hypothetical protein L596_010248 [Steinernema carpocapsae]|uniref:Uncharacterized protein n=1 Tax=Steinernema carpocapsae TaxID=34508 RepID=A0A4U5PI87_STECR|nr:hypothetical protein L596_010248 [Steinernema carpocapsae]
MLQDPQILLGMLDLTATIGIFVFAGISVTKYLSATTRAVLGSSRILMVWAVSVPLFGKRIYVLQIVGFVMLVFGIIIYNDLLIGSFVRLRLWLTTLTIQVDAT